MPSEEPRRTRDQERAQIAYQAVMTAVSVCKKPDRYASGARDLPIMLLKCGIGQTLAFLDSKRKAVDDAETLLLDQLSDWLGDAQRINVPKPLPARPGWLLEGLLERDSDNWHDATTEAVAYATWLKRFADALVPEKTDRPDQHEEPATHEDNGEEREDVNDELR